MNEENKGFNITALILGIISLVTFCFWYISIPCGIIAIIFGIIGRKKGGKGMGTAGIICGAIAVVLYIVISIFVYGLIFTSEKINDDVIDDIQKRAEEAVKAQNSTYNEQDEKIIDNAINILEKKLYEIENNEI